MESLRRKPKKHRPCPSCSLGKPQRRFADTFHAVTLLQERYFPNGQTEPTRSNPPKEGEND